MSCVGPHTYVCRKTCRVSMTERECVCLYESVTVSEWVGVCVCVYSVCVYAHAYMCACIACDCVCVCVFLAFDWGCLSERFRQCFLPWACSTPAPQLQRGERGSGAK